MTKAANDYSGMNEEMKAKWIKGLRDGSHKQIIGRLTDGTGFCALGVLADVAGIVHESNHFGNEVFVFDGDEHGSALSVSFMRKHSINEWACEEILTMNDDGKLPFGEIADWIEARL